MDSLEAIILIEHIMFAKMAMIKEKNMKCYLKL